MYCLNCIFHWTKDCMVSFSSNFLGRGILTCVTWAAMTVGYWSQLVQTPSNCSITEMGMSPANRPPTSKERVSYTPLPTTIMMKPIKREGQSSLTILLETASNIWNNEIWYERHKIISIRHCNQCSSDSVFESNIWQQQHCGLYKCAVLFVTCVVSHLFLSL